MAKNSFLNLKPTNSPAKRRGQTAPAYFSLATGEAKDGLRRNFFIAIFLRPGEIQIHTGCTSTLFHPGRKFFLLKREQDGTQRFQGFPISSSNDFDLRRLIQYGVPPIRWNKNINH
jgi:hypothetical protein